MTNHTPVFLKDPNAVRPYHVVWCDLSGLNDGSATDDGELQGATISTMAWTVPSGITKDSDHKNALTIQGVSYGVNTVCTIVLSGGTVNTDYDLVCRITTSDGRTLDQTITIMVRQS